MAANHRNTEPLPGTYLATPRGSIGPAKIYYQNNHRPHGLLCRLDPNGKAVVEEHQRPMIQHSPLSFAEFSYPPHLPAPSPHVFGKNNLSAIIPVIPHAGAYDINIESVEDSKFAAIEHNHANVYVHYESARMSAPPGHSDIVGTKLGSSTDEVYDVANNAARTQPIAAISVDDGFRSKHSFESAKAKNPGATVGEFGSTRYTVYHGEDKYLWLSETFDIGPFDQDYKTISTQHQISTVLPGGIFVDKTHRSPLAISAAPGRLVVYFLNNNAEICRISLHHGKGWGKAIPLHPVPPPRRGTNLAVTLQLINTMLHTTIHVAYQDAEGQIRSFSDTFIWNDPQ